jgi:hypothetical protein
VSLSLLFNLVYLLSFIDSTSLTHPYHGSQHTFRFTPGRAVVCENCACCYCRPYPHNYLNPTPVRASYFGLYTQTYKAPAGPAHQDASYLETLDQSLWAHEQGMKMWTWTKMVARPSQKLSSN